MFSLTVICYLFLGGCGAGAVAVCICLESSYARRARRRNPAESKATFLVWTRVGRALAATSATAYLVSCIMLAIGAFCLFTDLGSPDNAILLFVRPKPSWLSAGTFLLAGLIVGTAALALDRNLGLTRSAPRIGKSLDALCLFLSFGVMLYTGMFLCSIGTGVPIWSSPFVPAIFLLSSLSGGTAIFYVCALATNNAEDLEPVVGRLLGADDAIIACEAICAVAYLASILAFPSTRALLENGVDANVSCAFLFGFCLCGLCVPVFVKLLLGNRLVRFMPAVASLSLALIVGCFCLRFCIVDAGSHPDAASSFSTSMETLSADEGVAGA